MGNLLRRPRPTVTEPADPSHDIIDAGMDEYQHIRGLLPDDSLQMISSIQSRLFEQATQFNRLSDNERALIDYIMVLLLRGPNPTDTIEIESGIGDDFRASLIFYIAKRKIETAIVDINVGYKGKGDWTINNLAMLMYLGQYGLKKIKFNVSTTAMEDEAYYEFVHLMELYAKHPISLRGTVFESIMEEFIGRASFKEEKHIWTVSSAGPSSGICVLEYEQQQMGDLSDGSIKAGDKAAHMHEDFPHPGMVVKKYIPAPLDHVEPLVVEGNRYEKRINVDDINTGVIEVNVNIKQWLMARVGLSPQEKETWKYKIKLLNATFLARGGNGMVFQYPRGMAVKIIGHYSLVESTSEPGKPMLSFSFNQEKTRSEDSMIRNDAVGASLRREYSKGWEYDATITDELYVWNLLTNKDQNTRETRNIVPLDGLHVFRTLDATKGWFLKAMAYPGMTVQSVVGANMPMMNCDLNGIIAQLTKIDNLNQRKAATDKTKSETEARLFNARLHISVLLASRVKWLHDNDVVHQDIKPENFLVALSNPGIVLTTLSDADFLDECHRMEILIGDFGAAVMWMENNKPRPKTTSQLYTSWYRPFERYAYFPTDYGPHSKSLEYQLKDDVFGSRYKADIYALGNTLLRIWGKRCRMVETLYGVRDTTPSALSFYVGLLSDQFLLKIAIAAGARDISFPTAIEEYMRIQVASRDNVKLANASKETDRSFFSMMMMTDPTERPNINEVLSFLTENGGPTSDVLYNKQLGQSGNRTYESYNVYIRTLDILNTYVKEEMEEKQYKGDFVQKRQLTASEFKAVVTSLVNPIGAKKIKMTDE